jgi:hypothetical protein
VAYAGRHRASWRDLAHWFVAFSLHTYGDWLPPYYFILLLFLDPGGALLGHLVSPSRGLFVYVPAAGVVFILVALAWRVIPDRALAVVALAVCGAHLIVVSGFQVWWGGSSYGPRLLTGLLPWLVILAIQALAGVREWPASRYRAAMWACAVTAIAGVLVNAPGAFSQAADTWNSTPTDVNVDLGRLWDWRDPQFLAVRRPR